MRQQIINIYQFGELSESAQKRAYEDFAYSDSFTWNDDYRNSLKKISEYFSLKLKDWSVDEWRYEISFVREISEWESPSELIEADRTWLLSWRKKFNEGKSFTGFCADYDFMEPVMKMSITEETIQEMEDEEITELLKECYRSFFKAWQNDIEYSNSEENFKENVAPMYEYTVDGAIF